MTTFYAILIAISGAGSLYLGYVFFLKGDTDSASSGDESNLATLRNLRSELEEDFKLGNVSVENYQDSKAGLEYRYLEERSPVLAVVNSKVNRAPILMLVLSPLLAIPLYMMFGNSEAIFVEKELADSISSITQEEFREMTIELSTHLNNNPDDLKGWVMLGRAYFILNDFEKAVSSWLIASEIEKKNIELKINLLEAMILRDQGRFTQESDLLINEILVDRPSDVKVLSLAGGSAFSKGRYGDAIDVWKKILTFDEVDPKFTDAVKNSIEEAEFRKNSDGEPEITGTVSLGKNLTALDLPEDYYVFIVLRDSRKSSVPIIVDKVSKSALPYKFKLDRSMLMRPGTKFSIDDQYVLSGFISKSDTVNGKLNNLEAKPILVNGTSKDIELIIN